MDCNLSYQQRAYRAAVALNNLGVAMLEHRQYRQAHDTLLDGLVAAAYAASLRHAQPSPDDPMRVVELWIRTANERTARPQYDDSAPLPITLLTCDASFATLGFCSKIETGAVYAFRIDEGVGDLDLVCGIAIYNCGVSFYASALDDVTRADSLRSTAISFFAIANSILVRCEDQYQMLLIVTAIYDSAAKVFEDEGRFADAGQCRCLLDRLRLTALEAELQLDQIPPSAGAA